MSIFHAHQNQTFSLAGNHMSGLATPARGASSVEVWRGTMDAGAATPPHQHEHEEIVVFLSGHGRATIGMQEVPYQAGDTVILPPRTVHQIFAEAETELFAAMPVRDPITDPAGQLLDLPWRK